MLLLSTPKSFFSTDIRSITTLASPMTTISLQSNIAIKTLKFTFDQENLSKFGVLKQGSKSEHILQLLILKSLLYKLINAIEGALLGVSMDLFLVLIFLVGALFRNIAAIETKFHYCSTTTPRICLFLEVGTVGSKSTMIHTTWIEFKREKMC